MSATVIEKGRKGEPLPFGVLQFGSLFFFVAVGLLVIAVLGIRAYGHEYSEGIGVSAMKNIGEGGGAAWGLYIVMDITFLGFSFAGLTIASLIRLFGARDLEALERPALLLALVSLCLAGCCVVADLGRPLHGLWLLPKFARPMSPFFGTFTVVVSGYLTACLTSLYIASRRDAHLCARAARQNEQKIAAGFFRTWALGYCETSSSRIRTARAKWWLALLLTPLLCGAYSTLGFIFGIQVGRPGWYGTLQAPAFVVLAGVSGVGLLLFVLPLLRRFIPGFSAALGARAFSVLGNSLWVLASAYIYFSVSEHFTATYAGSFAARKVAHALTHGDYAVPFWLAAIAMLLAFLLPFLCLVTRRWSPLVLAFAGLMAIIGAILRRYLLVAGSQTHGSLLGERAAAYVPTAGEIIVMAGLTSLGVLVVMVLIKLFPAARVELEADGNAGASSELSISTNRGATLRHLLAVLTFACGLGIAVWGFVNSPGAVPRSGIAFAPVGFILGMMLTFATVVVYELIPD